MRQVAGNLFGYVFQSMLGNVPGLPAFILLVM